MPMQLPGENAVTFEQAKVRATEYLNSEKKMRWLLSQAHRKARRNYEFLLGPWESLQIFFRLVRAWLAGEYAASVVTVVAVAAAIIYFVEPLDLIPDPLPVLGYLDDAAVIFAVARANLNEISRFRKWENS